MKKILLGVLLALAIIPATVNAQDGNNTLYLLPNAPQRYKLNAAYQPEFKTYVGLPVLGGMGASYFNTSFGLDDFLTHRRTDGNDSVILNVNDLQKSLKNTNRIIFNQDVTLLAVGVKLGEKGYMTIDISEKIDAGFGFDKALIDLVANGNSAYIGKTQDLGKIGLDVTAYLESAFGYSRVINDKLTVGGRFKILFGVANANMSRSKLTLTSAADGENLMISSRQTIRMSAPLKNLEDNQIVDWDDFEFDADHLTDAFSNIGFGIDMGATYKLNNDFTLFASVNDLGFIHWNSNTHSFKEDVDFLWEGADLSNSINKNDPDYKELDDAFSDLTDSLSDSFRFVNSAAAYTTMLKANITVGGTYKVCDMFNAGAMLRGVMLADKFYPSLTLSGNARLLKNLGMSVSYSMMKGNPANIGFGLTGRCGPLQLYLVTDNLLASNYTHTRSASFRFGINILAGCLYKDKKNKN